MVKRALLVGINHYDLLDHKLSSSIINATNMYNMFKKNADGSPNYSCRTINEFYVTQELLNQHLEWLFHGAPDYVVFYFSGRGNPHAMHGYLMTSDANPDNPGLPMTKLIKRINKSRARDIIIILDCCSSPHESTIFTTNSTHKNLTTMREDVTILSSVRLDLSKLEDDVAKPSVFTASILNALDGGAADIRGNVSAPSIYRYVEEMGGTWNQGSFCRCYTRRLSTLRVCKPVVPVEYLRELPLFFPEPTSIYKLDPSIIHEASISSLNSITVFTKLSKYYAARLIENDQDNDLVFAAMQSHSVRLTATGKSYWHLANNDEF